MTFTEEVLLIFLALLAVSAVVYAGYSSWYRKHTARAQDEEPPGSDSEPPRGGRIFLFCLLVGCVLVFLLWALRLQGRVDELEQALDYNLNKLSERLDENYQALRYELGRQSELFESVERKAVRLDPDNGLLEIQFTVVPKLSSAETIVKVSAPPQEQILERQPDNSFTGVFRIDLFSDWNGSIQLSLTEGGITKTQLTNFQLEELRGSFLPWVDCSASCQVEDGKTVSLDGSVSVESPLHTVSAMTAELLRGDQVVCSSELTLHSPSSSGYAYSEFSMELPEPLAQDDTLVLRLCFTDSLGLRHRFDALAIVGGRPAGYTERIGDPAGFYFYWIEILYNAEGRCLFDFSDGVG